MTTNQNLNALGKVDPINVGMGPYRADRIEGLLAKNNEINCETMVQLHYDVYSTQAQAFMAILEPLLPESETAAVLKQWDFRYTADSKGAYLFERFYRQLYREVFGKHGLGADAVDHIDQHTGVFNDFYINFDRILLSETSVWFGGRTRDEIYREAAEKALSAPVKKWGDERGVILKNIVFDGKLPRFLGFDRGPITIIGSLATPHQGQIFESAGRLTTFAPSFRMVIDLATDEIQTNLAGGPSDRRFSRWYCSDLENWVAGRYKTVDTNPDSERLAFP